MAIHTTDDIPRRSKRNKTIFLIKIRTNINTNVEYI